jgi:hypothetical protein
MDKLEKEAIKATKIAIKAGATAIKVELEGHVGRYSQSGQVMSCAEAHKFLLSRIKKLGLVKNVSINSHTPISPLVFSHVYGDCETEWTFTIKLDKPENVLLIVEFIKAFKDLAKFLKKRSINTDGAGMHMAYLFDKECRYPSRADLDLEDKYRAFKKSVTPLLPALFFMSANKKKKGVTVTRSSDARSSVISHDKFSAIHFDYNTLEFRVFDTVYTNPRHALMNAIVMGKCMRYWTGKVSNKKLYNSYDRVEFGGFSTNVPLTDIFYAKEHVYLLNEGLKRVKPAHVSVKALKQARQFNVTQRQRAKFKAGSIYGGQVLK